MPELPEVETTIRDLQTKVLKRTFVNVWTDSEKIVKKPKSFERFKKELKGKKIQKIWRRGKNIIFELSQGYSLLIHQKLTGHLLYGNWDKRDKANTYIHLKFSLDNEKMLALSDLRKFAKVELWKIKELKNSKGFKSLGPEPLDKKFTFEKFKQVLKNKRGKIKQILMNQEIIAGIGNIYSDEILWRVKIHPFRDVSKLKEEELKKIYQTMKRILKKAIELRGESISDYRDPAGRKGRFDRMRKVYPHTKRGQGAKGAKIDKVSPRYGVGVYRREGKKCSRCRTIIQRKKIAGRSTHFCPKCQKLNS